MSGAADGGAAGGARRAARRAVGAAAALALLAAVQGSGEGIPPPAASAPQVVQGHDLRAEIDRRQKDIDRLDARIGKIAAERGALAAELERIETATGAASGRLRQLVILQDQVEQESLWGMLLQTESLYEAFQYVRIYNKLIDRSLVEHAAAAGRRAALREELDKSGEELESLEEIKALLVKRKIELAGKLRSLSAPPPSPPANGIASPSF